MRSSRNLTLIFALFTVPARGEDARPVAASDDSGLAILVEALGQVDDVAVQLDVLQGMRDALRGRKQLRAPKDWSVVYDKLAKSQTADVREKARLLALIFGDSRAVESLRAPTESTGT